MILKGNYKIINDIMFVEEYNEVVALFIANGTYDVIGLVDDFEDNTLIQWEKEFVENSRVLSKEEEIEHYTKMHSESLDAASEYIKKIKFLMSE